MSLLNRCGLRPAAARPLRTVNVQRAHDFHNHPMSDPQALDLPALRLALSERAAALRDDLRRDRRKLADDTVNATTVLDRKDQADAMIQAGVDDAELERDLAELALVEAALQRLDGGRFGRCVECAEPIAPERLAAQPWVPRCVACQGRVEQRTPRSAA